MSENLLSKDLLPAGWGLQWAEGLYATFTRPQAFLQQLNNEPVTGLNLFNALLTVLLISAMLSVSGVASSAMGNPDGSAGWVSSVVFSVVSGAFFSAVGGAFSWLLVGFLFSTLTWVFTGQSRLKACLASTGWATAPWVLFPFAGALKAGLAGLLGPVAGGVLGGLLGSTLAAGLWGWSVTLFVVALRFSLNLPPERLGVLLGLLFALAWLPLAWFIGFFTTLGRVFG